MHTLLANTPSQPPSFSAPSPTYSSYLSPIPNVQCSHLIPSFIVFHFYFLIRFHNLHHLLPPLITSQSLVISTALSPTRLYGIINPFHLDSHHLPALPPAFSRTSLHCLSPLRSFGPDERSRPKTLTINLPPQMLPNPLGFSRR